ncbi:F-box/LRR-repeat protein At3g03360-like [Ipomoea triloba]|uniref:F-box/LRR-repeat protein At3g03360-like n=1 Tax=Ipomoea triloba TaxID=35885 RepID=UPI00125E4B5E|nr:F-box/LRR-repeat protein At3g03360-like [Ipomoea triloba]
MGARKDIISELPDDVKEKILECLPIRDVARTALLSTDWKDVWLRHGRLVFDTHFLECLRKCEGDKPVGLVNVINHILLHRAGPVKKFSLCISCPGLEGPKPQQSDIDGWCVYLSRNGVEELNISVFGKQYKLPSCIISCPTIKQLILGGFNFDIDCPIDGVGGCIFHGVTSLVFYGVEFKSRINGGVVPNLEKISFSFCVGINNFKICAPKLKSLDLAFVFPAFEPRWLSPHSRLVRAYCLDLLGFGDVAVVAQEFPTTNLQVIWVIESEFGQITVALELLERSPNQCELKIQAENTLSSRLIDKDLKDAASRLMKDSSLSIMI